MLAGKSVRFPGHKSSFSMEAYYDDIKNVFKDILASNTFDDFSGWIFLNTEIDNKGK
jgi:hypothetical protein